MTGTTGTSTDASRPDASDPDVGLSGASAVDPAVQRQVDAARARVESMVAADPDLVPGDAVEVIALDCPLEVAVELCSQSMNFIPDTVRQRVFEAEHVDSFTKAAALSAERDAAARKSAQRTSRAAATRAATLKAEVAVESAQLRSATCPVCFTIRAASGVCACE